MNIVTTNFREVLDAFDKELVGVHPDEHRAALLGFAQGMQAGAAVLQNRMAVTAMEVKRLPPQEKKKILQYLIQTCMDAQIELDKINMDTIGMPYGTA